MAEHETELLLIIFIDAPEYILVDLLINVSFFQCPKQYSNDSVRPKRNQRNRFQTTL